jgi:hypothetical protein
MRPIAVARGVKPEQMQEEDRMPRSQPLIQHGIRLSAFQQRFELVQDVVIQLRCIYPGISLTRFLENGNIPEVKSSSSASYIHIKTLLFSSSGSSSLRPSIGGGANIGKMSGLPKEKVVEE